MPLKAGRRGLKTSLVDAMGNLKSSAIKIAKASKSVFGIVKIGDGLSVSGGVVSYTLPIASADTVGAVKQGTNITISADGTISAEGGGTFGTFTATDSTDHGYIISQNGNNISVNMTCSFTTIGSGSTKNIGTISGVSLPSASTEVGVAIASRYSSTPSVQLRVYVDATGTVTVKNDSGAAWGFGDKAYIFGCWKVGA